MNERLSDVETASNVECVGVISQLVLESFTADDPDNVYKQAKGLLTILQMMPMSTFDHYPEMKALTAMALLCSGLTLRLQPSTSTEATVVLLHRIQYNHLKSGDRNHFENSAAGSLLLQSINYRLRLALQPITSAEELPR